jgi:gephyrin
LEAGADGITSLQALVKDMPPSTTPNTEELLAPPLDRFMRVGLLTISDRASDGTYEDKSGPEMRRQLELMNLSFAPIFAHSAIVSDEPLQIQQKLREWIDSGSVDMVLTSGGTGFGRRDNTPEAVKVLFHREAPGIAQALLAEGLKHTPLAVLSRPVAGTRGNCFIATLPGSAKAVRENLRALQPLLPRIMELLIDNTCGHTPVAAADVNARAGDGGVVSRAPHPPSCDCCK